MKPTDMTAAITVRYTQKCFLHMHNNTLVMTSYLFMSYTGFEPIPVGL